MRRFISLGGASRSKASPVNSSAVVVTSRGVTIFEEEEEEDRDSIKNRVIRRIDTRLIFQTLNLLGAVHK